MLMFNDKIIMTTQRQKNAVDVCERTLKIKFNGDIDNNKQVSGFLGMYLDKAKKASGYNEMERLLLSEEERYMVENMSIMDFYNLYMKTSSLPDSAIGKIYIKVPINMFLDLYKKAIDACLDNSI